MFRGISELVYVFPSYVMLSGPMFCLYFLWDEGRAVIPTQDWDQQKQNI